MILTVLVICAVLALGILLGIEINQYFGNDNYWKGYDNGFADGYDERMEEYDIKESSKPTPSEFLEQFEDCLNSKGEELDDYDTGWNRGYECGKHNGNYMRGYWKGYDDGWEGCKCGKERKYPLDRVYEDFEKEVNNEL